LRIESATRVGRASVVVNLLVMQRALGPDIIDYFSDVHTYDIWTIGSSRLQYYKLDRNATKSTRRLNHVTLIVTCHANRMAPSDTNSLASPGFASIAPAGNFCEKTGTTLSCDV
jgi:hypothetical protein